MDEGERETMRSGRCSIVTSPLSASTVTGKPPAEVWSSAVWSAASDEAEGALSTMLQEDLTDVRVVRAFGQQKAEIERLKKEAENQVIPI